MEERELLAKQVFPELNRVFKVARASCRQQCL